MWFEEEAPSSMAIQSNEPVPEDSQDQDLAEAVAEIREIAKSQSRFVELYSAFPLSNRSTNSNPIRGTNAFPIDQATYESCLDPSNYTRRP